MNYQSQRDGGAQSSSDDTVQKKYSDKVAKLSDKLSNLQFDNSFGDDNIPLPASPKQQSKQTYDSQFHRLETDLKDLVQTTQQKVRILTDKLSDYSKYLQDDRLAQEQQHDEQLKELKAIELLVIEKLESEKRARAEMESRLMQAIDEKFRALKTEVCRESRERYESVEQLKVCLENDFPQLQEMIQGETAERTGRDEILRARAEEQVQEVEAVIGEEKSAREETEEAILEMLKDMVGKIKNEIENERRERLQNNETLLGLLEDTCLKFGNEGLSQIK